MTTKVSSKYQVVIPKEIRERIQLKEGEELEVLQSGNSIVLTPVRKWPHEYVGSLGGFWKDVDPVKYVREMRDEW